MPVTTLYCEGGPVDPPDQRVIRKILAELQVLVEPVGGKGELKNFLTVLRREGISWGRGYYGLRDRDFDDQLVVATSSPQPWLERVDNRECLLGWKWARNSLENYLIDPAVVSRALNWSPETTASYAALLLSTANTLTHYTAARYILTDLRNDYRITLPNCWGERSGLDGHPMPQEMSQTDCEQGIAETLVAASPSRPSAKSMKKRYDAIDDSCQPGGKRHAEFLTYFSGKDLLVGMERMEPGLKAFKFNTAAHFRNILLLKIQDSHENVWEWLEEWTALRVRVQQIP